MSHASAPPAPDSHALAPVTVLTGGSRGIGRALAREFAAGGHALLLVARDEAALARVKAEIAGLSSAPVDCLVLDLADATAADLIEAHLAEKRQYCRQLVNNAGFGLAGAFVGHDEAEISAMLDVNMRVLTQLTRRFLPDMLARRDGGVLNVASLGGMVAGPYQAAYYASKAYVLSFTRALAWECWGSKVRISVLVPGPVRTDFHQRMGARNALYVRLGSGISAKAAARMGYTGFMCGKQMIIPGLFGPFNALALKVIPHDLLMPVIGWFLKARSGGGNNV